MSLRNTDYLTIRLSALGDAILTTGVLEYWRQTRGLRAHVITRAALAPLFEHHPAVAEIIPIETKHLDTRSWMTNCWHLSQSHGRMPFVDLHGNLRSRILRFIWPSITCSYPKYSITRRLFLATRHPYFSAKLLRYNVPQRYSLALETRAPAKEELRPSLFLTEEERAAGKQLLLSRGIERPVAIHPYATHPAKTPPAQVWQACIDTLRANGTEVIVLGQNSTKLLADDTADFTNQTSLRMTAAVLVHCRCLLTGDSGPMHLATAVGTPVAAMFGPTTPEWGFYPSGAHDIAHKISCPDAPCSLHGQDACRRQNACMANLSPQELINLIKEL